jgi:hypothetical protein
MTVISTLSGVRHQFRANCQVFEHPLVRAFKTALNLEERKRDGCALVDRKHPPTVDMIHITNRQKDTSSVGNKHVFFDKISFLNQF